MRKQECKFSDSLRYIEKTSLVKRFGNVKYS